MSLKLAEDVTETSLGQQELGKHRKSYINEVELKYADKSSTAIHLMHSISDQWNINLRREVLRLACRGLPACVFLWARLSSGVGSWKIGRCSLFSSSLHLPLVGGTRTTFDNQQISRQEPFVKAESRRREWWMTERSE
jgi:hypothetical protein